MADWRDSLKFGNRGGTLVEALVVILILGLSALSLSGMQSLLWLNGETALQREQALLRARADGPAPTGNRSTARR